MEICKIHTVRIMELHNNTKLEWNIFVDSDFYSGSHKEIKWNSQF